MIDRLHQTQDTIVVNTKNGVHSRYTGFAFNGLFTLNGKLYGTNATGIYELVGDEDYKDATAGKIEINSEIETAVVDFREDGAMTCADAYLQMRTSGEMVLDVTVDETSTVEELPFIYADTGLRNWRAKLPKGLRGANWQFKLRNLDGTDFTLSSGLQVLRVPSRRTR